jgi:hypothetical protein
LLSEYRESNVSDPHALFMTIPLVDGLLAYVGPGAGLELVPYFWALLGFAGAALLAVVQWPLAVFFRWFPKAREDQPNALTNQLLTTAVPETSGEGCAVKP